MDLDRPHRSTSISNGTTTSNELFICFTSRLSSSSMKLSSKSILSPGHTREPSSQISVPSSLSRRLRSNGSMKGGQASPMFPTNGRKRGSGFENPEPSSPKVTCIGQVRVKTKKQSRKLRACRSARRGEVGFRNGSNNGIDTTSIRLLRNGSQQQECKRWVHLPVTICEALRGFGAEFNCFLPCRSSSCMASSQSVKEEKTGGSDRWVVVSEEEEDNDDERRENGEMMMVMRSSQRRHVFEDIDINDYCDKNFGGVDDEDEEEKEEGGKVSICIPPKNALLLMRCRSDPVKMAALANKFWETPLPQEEEEEEEEEADNESESESEERKVETFEEENEHQEVSEVSEMFVSCEATEEQEIQQAEAVVGTEAESVYVRDETEVIEGESLGECSKEETTTQCREQEHETEMAVVEEKDQEESAVKEETLPQAQVSFDLDKLQVEENVPENEQEDENVCVEAEEEEEEEETEGTQGRSGMGEPDPDESKVNQSQPKLLPDCLLLMMCEPKLSMEVSKETWVCSTDFIRCVPKNKKKNPSEQVKQKDGGDQPTKTRISIDPNPPTAPILLQPRRSSCSFPVAPPMAAAVAAAAKGACGGGPMASMIEKKLVGGKVYEPFVLARCKSEPRRSSTKLAPDTCFWKNGKLEPAAVGF